MQIAFGSWLVPSCLPCVAGAYVTKIFGRPHDDIDELAEKAGRVSAIGVRTAICGSLFGTAIMIVTVVATSFAYGWGGVLTVQHKRSESKTGLSTATRRNRHAGFAPFP